MYRWPVFATYLAVESRKWFDWNEVTRAQIRGRVEMDALMQNTRIALGVEKLPTVRIDPVKP